jgi:phospho-N-acetylmuramoyl-pentapeptide-transferase
LHHHFEMIGWKETKVTTRFHIVTLILSLLGAICLKLR